MNSDLADAIREWNCEVDNEAVELIESGVAPYDAVERAKSIVSARRREKKAGARRSQEGGGVGDERKG